MTIHVDLERFTAIPVRGWPVMSGLVGAAATMAGSAAQAGRDAGSGPERARRSAEVVGRCVAAVNDRVSLLERMLAAGGAAPWAVGAFANPTELGQAFLVLAGLADRSTLTAHAAALVGRAESLDVDRQWMDAQSIGDRMQLMALVTLRWLPELHADGAGNCFRGVLTYFASINEGAPGSFASLVDSVILVSFLHGIARVVNPETDRDYEVGSERWAEFFEHRLADPDDDWKPEAFHLWSNAEQAATEAGYVWAAERNVMVSPDMVRVTLGGEVFRWANRQRGRESDPVQFLGRQYDRASAGWVGWGAALAGAPGTGAITRLRQRSVDAKVEHAYRALDPRNPDFTYDGARALDLVFDNDRLSVPEGLLPGSSDEPLPAAVVAANSQRNVALLDALGRGIAAEHRVSAAACDALSEALPGCRS